jgi:superfamily II DNA or RNA helicase
LAFPEVGQIVKVRDRHWAVADIIRTSLPPDVAKPGGTAPHTLVELSSVEDDGQGELLTVAWELEPGTAVLTASTLPSMAPESVFDSPSTLSSFLDAIRWGAVTSLDTHALQAPFRSGITLDDYQLDPVVRALSMPRANLLIADDVGLGKTIEAGLVVQEFLLRYRARTALVVCPANLKHKWQREMQEKFGLEFRIIDAQSVRALRRAEGVAANVFTAFPRNIVSIDWLKDTRGMRLMRQCLGGYDPTRYPRAFDFLIVDEIHDSAPSGRGRYAVDSQRTRTIREIAPHFEHRLFLSATPHNGYSESFTALLELLDPQRFARGVEPSKTSLAHVMVRRLKHEIKNADGSDRFAKRLIVPIKVEYTADERQAHALLSRYAKLRSQGNTDRRHSMATEFVTKLLKKRLFSSVVAFRNTLEEHLKTQARYEGIPEPTERELERLLSEADQVSSDDMAVDSTFRMEQSEPVQDGLVASGRVMRPLTDEERKILAELRAWADKNAYRVDARAKNLIDWIKEACCPGGVWNDERVIVFTEYRDTQAWLQQLLASEGLAGERLGILHGSMDDAVREQILAHFQADPHEYPLRILLATDTASEGIDLQNHCHMLFHYEIPWSPVRLEQRNGRIDRHGQTAPEVLIHHFIPSGYEKAKRDSLEFDLEILGLVARKVENIRNDLGSTGDVLAQQIEEIMTGRRDALDDSALADRQVGKRALTALERNIREEVARLHARLDESRTELNLSPLTVERLVSCALSLANQPPLKPLSDHDSVFDVPTLTGSWSRTIVDLEHPLKRYRRPITFDQEVASKRKDSVVLVHLGHPLAVQSMRLLRAELWAPASRRKLSRMTAVEADREDVAVVAHARVAITGADGHRLHEALIQTGGRIRTGSFSRLNVGETQAAIGSATGREAEATGIRDLHALWSRIEEPLLRALEARKEEVASSLERQLDQRRLDEQKALTTVVTELRASIDRQLKALETDQNMQLFLEGFGPSEQDQREQAKRDIENLRRRMVELPGELEREQETIARRFMVTRTTLFPAAVTWLVPRGVTS